MNVLTESLAALLDYARRLHNSRHARRPGRPMTCAYRGPALVGLNHQCETCRGRVSLKVFECSHPSGRLPFSCTPADCRECSDFLTQSGLMGQLP